MDWFVGIIVMQYLQSLVEESSKCRVLWVHGPPPAMPTQIIIHLKRASMKQPRRICQDCKHILCQGSWIIICPTQLHSPKLSLSGGLEEVDARLNEPKRLSYPSQERPHYELSLVWKMGDACLAALALDVGRFYHLRFTFASVKTHAAIII